MKVTYVILEEHLEKVEFLYDVVFREPKNGKMEEVKRLIMATAFAVSFMARDGDTAFEQLPL